jgi:hypothetical protein
MTTMCAMTDPELRRRGYLVSGLDYAPTAIDWCRRRFPDATPSGPADNGTVCPLR